MELLVWGFASLALLTASVVAFWIIVKRRLARDHRERIISRRLFEGRWR
jgi:hypothetical protein